MGCEVAGVLVAAGSGTRMGGGVPKTLRALGGRPLFLWSLEVMVQVCERVALVVSAAHRQEFERALAPTRANVDVIEGGDERWQSVQNGLEHLRDSKYAVVHDAARPFATRDLFERALAEARRHGAAVCAAPVTDTLKEVDLQGRVVATPNRERLRAAQTPQVFYTALLWDVLDAYRRGQLRMPHAPTDDASFVEAAGGLVYCVEGHPCNRKLTDLHDWAWAEQYAKEGHARR